MNNIKAPGLYIITAAFGVDRYNIDWDLNFQWIRKFLKKFFKGVRLTKIVVIDLPISSYYGIRIE